MQRPEPLEPSASFPIMILDTLPPEILMIIVNHLANDLYKHPKAPKQLISLAASCHRFRALIYTELWQNAKLMTFHDHHKVLVQKHAHSYIFACLLSDREITKMPGSVLAYIQTLEMHDTHDLVELDIAHAQNPIPAYELVHPKIMPLLNSLFLTSLSSKAWNWLSVNLFKYSTPVKLNLRAPYFLPYLPPRINYLITNLYTVVPSYNSHPAEFEKTWANIAQMQNLSSLNLDPSDAVNYSNESTEKSVQVVTNTLFNLPNLTSLYIDSYPISLPTNRAWMPHSLTTLECSNSNFVHDPTGPDTDRVGPDLFQTVKKLTMVIICDTLVPCIRLPFRKLGTVHLIGQRTGQLDTTVSLNKTVMNLIRDNPQIEHMTIVITWDLDLQSITASHLKSVKTLSVSFQQQTLSSNPKALNSLFQIVAQLENLTTFSLRVPNHSHSNVFLTHTEFEQFAYAAVGLKRFNFCVQLTGHNRFLPFIQEKSDNSISSSTRFLQFLPIEGVVNSAAGRYFHFEGYRESPSFGQSWIINYVFDLHGFRLAGHIT